MSRITVPPQALESLLAGDAAGCVKLLTAHIEQCQGKGQPVEALVYW
jgi:hypothetical protein